MPCPCIQPDTAVLISSALSKLMVACCCAGDVQRVIDSIVSKWASIPTGLLQEDFVSQMDARIEQYYVDCIRLDEAGPVRSQRCLVAWTMMCAGDATCLHASQHQCQELADLLHIACCISMDWRQATIYVIALKSKDTPCKSVHTWGAPLLAAVHAAEANCCLQMSVRQGQH